MTNKPENLFLKYIISAEKTNTKKLQGGKIKLLRPSVICPFYAWIIIILYNMATDFFLHQDDVSASICRVACRVASWSYSGDGLALFNRKCCSQGLNQLCPPGAVSPAQALPISPAALSGSSPMSSFAPSGPASLAQHTRPSGHQVRLLLAQCQDPKVRRRVS